MQTPMLVQQGPGRAAELRMLLEGTKAFLSVEGSH